MYQFNPVTSLTGLTLKNLVMDVHKKILHRHSLKFVFNSGCWKLTKSPKQRLGIHVSEINTGTESDQNTYAHLQGENACSNVRKDSTW